MPLPLRRLSIRAYDRVLGPHEVPRHLRRAFRRLTPGRVAVDCGANVGEVTALLARRGADVYAFEPNPHAFEVLARRFAGSPDVRCFPQAVWTAEGRTRLYLHEDATSDQVARSSGSSFFGTKANVDPGAFVEVETVDLAAFLDSLGRPVDVLKLDVEGAEVGILERLLGSGRLAAIGLVLVELHDTRIPELRAAGAELRARLAAPAYSHVHLDWV